MKDIHAKTLDVIRQELGDVDVVTRQQLADLSDAGKIKWPTWLMNDKARRIGRGKYMLNAVKAQEMPVVTEAEKVVEVAAKQVASPVDLYTGVHDMDLVPQKFPGYVKFGWYNDVKAIFASKKFYPIYVTGLSGNGKTLMCEQACAELGREFIRANITIETDEDDLFGGFRLVDGKTIFQPGPALIAMERGAVLLLDEVDLGSNKLLCLQPVLEGKAVYVKKINRVIQPTQGFTVVATANTKGQGSDDGRFIGTNVLNEAFLERFPITMEQEYPSVAIEKKILNKVLEQNGVEDEGFAEKLVQWADAIRRSFYDDAVSDIISTRRLVNICQAYAIFGRNKDKALQLCLARFDSETKGAFMELYSKLDESMNDDSTVVPATSQDDNIPF